MQAKERRTIAVGGYVHGLTHANIVAIPVFLALAWSRRFTADPETLGLLAAAAYEAFGLTFLSVFGVGSVGAAIVGLLLQQDQKEILFTGLGLSRAGSGACALLAGRASRIRPGA